MKITKRGKYQTRDGRKVRIYAVNGRGYYPVHGAVWKEHYWSIASWAANGQALLGADTRHLLDLIPAKKGRKGK